MNAAICAVVVTYNRLDKLKKALESYSTQTLLPKYLVVVDNASTDGTAAYLADWEKQEEKFTKIVITAAENMGGSGGFYLGQERAMELDADWIMLADDDAYPETNYLEGMYQFITTQDSDTLSIVCGKVIQNGTYISKHRAYLKNRWTLNFAAPAPKKFYVKDYFEIDFASYVGILINRKKLKQVGLVTKDFFIWNDDHEHTYRLKKVGRIVCLPAFTILHDAAGDHFELSWKLFYGFRNSIILLKKHFPFQYPFAVLFFVLKTLLSPLKGTTLTEVHMRFVAIKDGVSGKLGKHWLYKPGWKPK